jgi:ferredoxin
LIYIVGSGLSGIAAAVALVKRGYRPTILDPGLTPDAELMELKERLATLEPEQWRAEDLARLKQIGPAGTTGIPQKLHFGSDFAYRDQDPETSPRVFRASMLRSFALGGFSNVWGAVIQPFHPDEFRTWPIGQQQLVAHYDAIHQLICPSKSDIRPSPQATALYDDMAINRLELECRGIQFDFAGLAVRSSDRDGEKGCRYCGLCLYGCPYGSIFSAAATLSRMVRLGQISVISGVIVDRIATAKNGVRLEARSLDGDVPRVFVGRLAFIAAGLLESARIVLNSTQPMSAPLRILQSDIFTTPILRYRRVPGIRHERIHTLCQMIMKIDDQNVCRHPVSLQLYGYNDLYPQLLARRVGRLSRALSSTLHAASERLFVAFGYLHSDVSSSVRITRTAGGKGRLYLEGQDNPERTGIGAAVVRKLFQSRAYIRAIPVPFQLKFGEPGSAHRIGGSFPMRRLPTGLETDAWGRLPGLRSVHIVDSSVIPSIPAAPLAFTVMANAHRIASDCPIPDGR